MKPPAITQEQLKEIIHYEPETGAFTWRVGRGNQHAKAGSPAGTISNKGRRMIEIKGRAYLSNRLAWFYMTGEWPSLQVDHFDTDKLNDRWLNLRLLTNQGNKQNMRRARSDSQTGVMGVARAGDRFRAKIQMPNGKRKSLGTHPTAELAYGAFLSAKRQLHEGCTL